MNIPDLIGWVYGTTVVVIGVLNLVLVHPVPGIAYLVVSLIYLPPTAAILKKKIGFAIPRILKIIVGILVIQFTLGVSDLGDMIDKAF
ncbi:hypothetical protein F0P96_17130 [Hymenobacter busanensis]|uniref:Uncharacterized protein n=2 Tax=Hymenobacter busanensis TaxID=2607656 RepID=A0A7L5A576_9BACT|nr:hypothetical protein F0P96_17130 [Hymenobacter busanensis]QHJ09560.1 hypothetical protein GUY19_01100 [Hymenobacter busanensis]